MADSAAVAQSDVGSVPVAVRVGDALVPTWPDGQSMDVLVPARVVITRFADVERYHAALTAAVSAARENPPFVDAKPNRLHWACGAKVRHLARWEAPAASLLHARALALAHRVMDRGPVYADDTWASIYGEGDYCMPHSHMRSDVAIVYMLDCGERDAEDAAAGKLMLMDPRLDYCCPHEPGRATRPLIPDMAPGSMIAFSGECVHSVTPYRGRRPRITFSWNMTRTRLPERERMVPMA